MSIAQDAKKSTSPAVIVATNDVPFQPTRYSNVKVRHVPEAPPAPAILRAVVEGHRNPGIEVKGTSPAGGTVIRVDETHAVPLYVPALKAKPPTSVTHTNQP